ncbi:hypothetical protein L345_13890, partial [Ophiophagus hannah]
MLLLIKLLDSFEAWLEAHDLIRAVVGTLIASQLSRLAGFLGPGLSNRSSTSGVRGDKHRQPWQRAGYQKRACSRRPREKQTWPLRELGRVDWMWDWAQARLPKPLTEPLGRCTEGEFFTEPFEMRRSRQDHSPPSPPTRRKRTGSPLPLYELEPGKKASHLKCRLTEADRRREEQGAPPHQLQYIDNFLLLLEARFEEAEEDPYAEDELSSLKQRGRPIKEHICEFRMAIKDNGALHANDMRKPSDTKESARPENTQPTGKQHHNRSQNQTSHEAQLNDTDAGEWVTWQRRHNWNEAPDVRPFRMQRSLPTQLKREGTPGNDDQSPDSYDTEDKGKNEPIVSGLGTFQALIDSGCTRCLINLTVLKLGIRAERPGLHDLLGGSCRLRIAKGSQPPLHHQIETLPTQRTLPEGSPEQLAATSNKTPEVRQILREYKDLMEVFSETECDVLPPHHETDCAIEIIPRAKLPKPKMYAMMLQEMQEMCNYIDKNLAREFIKPAKPWVAAPDMLSHLDKGKVFTKLDLREAYYRVRIREGVKGYAFQTAGPPTVFMQLINEVLHKHLYKGVLVYLHSILMYTETMNDHIPLVRQIAKPMMDLLKTNSPGTKPHQGQPLQWDLTCQKAFETLKELFAKEPGALTCQKAFETLKELFAKEPVLKHPDPKQPFIIQADASDVAVGAVLLQRNNQWNLQPCAYTSCKLTDTERGFHGEIGTANLAPLAGQRPLEVWANHKNLEALRTPQKLSPKQGRNFLVDALSHLCQYKCEWEEVVDAIMTTLRPARPNCYRPLVLGHILTKRHDQAWKGTKLYVPESLHNLVLQRSHDAKPAGYFGFLKTLHLAQRQFWWPGIKKYIDSYVKSCTIYGSRADEAMGGDCNGLYSGVAKNGLPSAHQLARLFLKHIYSLHGVPRRIISDRGVHLLGHPRVLAQPFIRVPMGAERFNAMVKQYLRCYVNYQQSNWVDLLPFVEGSKWCFRRILIRLYSSEEPPCRGGEERGTTCWVKGSHMSPLWLGTHPPKTGDSLK